jgi:hypothetical protein
MKQILSVILVLLCTISCRKEAPAPAASPNTVLLTAQSWQYDEYYSGHGTATRKRVYKRNATGNSADFSVYQYIFKQDGRFEVKMGDESIYSNWKFTDNEKVIEISSGSGSPTLLKVSVLDPETFEWVMDEYYAKMIPKK